MKPIIVLLAILFCSPTIQAQNVTVPQHLDNKPCLATIETVINFSSIEDATPAHFITVGEYISFLNAIDSKEDIHVLYTTAMEHQILWTSKGNYNDYSLAKKAKDDEPMLGITLFDAMRYCNWLENGSLSENDDKSIQAAALASTEYGSYELHYNHVISTNPDATYHLVDTDANATSFAITTNPISQPSATQSQSSSPLMMFGGDEEESPAASVSDLRGTTSLSDARSRVAAGNSSQVARGSATAEIAEPTAAVSASAQRSLTLQNFRDALTANPSSPRFIIGEDGTIQPKNEIANAQGRNRSENMEITKAFRDALKREFGTKAVKTLLPQNHPLNLQYLPLGGSALRDIFNRAPASSSNSSAIAGAITSSSAVEAIPITTHFGNDTIPVAVAELIPEGQETVATALLTSSSSASAQIRRQAASENRPPAAIEPTAALKAQFTAILNEGKSILTQQGRARRVSKAVENLNKEHAAKDAKIAQEAIAFNQKPWAQASSQRDKIEAKDSAEKAALDADNSLRECADYTAKAEAWLSKAQGENMEYYEKHARLYTQAAEQAQALAKQWEQSAQAYRSGNAQQIERLENAADSLRKRGACLSKSVEYLVHRNYNWTAFIKAAEQSQALAELWRQSTQAHLAGSSEQIERWINAADSLRKSSECLSQAVEDLSKKYGDGAAYTWKEQDKIVEQAQASADYYRNAAQAHALGNLQEAERWQNAAASSQESIRLLSQVIAWSTKAVGKSSNHYPCNRQYTQAEALAEQWKKSAEAYASDNPEQMVRWTSAAESLRKSAEQLSKAESYVTEGVEPEKGMSLSNLWDLVKHTTGGWSNDRLQFDQLCQIIDQSQHTAKYYNKIAEALVSANPQDVERWTKATAASEESIQLLAKAAAYQSKTAAAEIKTTPKSTSSAITGRDDTEAALWNTLGHKANTLANEWKKAAQAYDSENAQEMERCQSSKHSIKESTEQLSQVEGWLTKAAEVKAEGNIEQADLLIAAARQFKSIIEEERSQLDRQSSSSSSASSTSTAKSEDQSRSFWKDAQQLAQAAEFIPQTATWATKATEERARRSSDLADLWTKNSEQTKALVENLKKTFSAYSSLAGRLEPSRLNNIVTSFRESSAHLSQAAEYLLQAAGAKTQKNPEATNLWTSAAQQAQALSENWSQVALNETRYYGHQLRTFEQTTMCLRNATTSLRESTASLSQAANAKAEGKPEAAALWMRAAKAAQLAVGELEKNFYNHHYPLLPINQLIKFLPLTSSCLIKAAESIAQANSEYSDLWVKVADQAQIHAELLKKDSAAISEKDVKRLKKATPSREGSAKWLSQAQEWLTKATEKREQGNQRGEAHWLEAARDAQEAAELYQKAAQAHLAAPGNNPIKKHEAEQAAEVFKRQADRLAKKAQDQAAYAEEL